MLDSVRSSPRRTATSGGGARRRHNFTARFNECFLGHRPEGVASLHVLLWGVTAVMRSGRERDIDQLPMSRNWSASSPAPRTLACSMRLLAGTHCAPRRAARCRSGARVGHEIAVTLTDLYTVAVCCNATIDDRMSNTWVMSDSWQKRYRIAAKSFRFNARRHDGRTRRAGSPDRAARPRRTTA